MRAIWNDAVLADSDDTVVVEGNHYFPADSLRREHFRPSDRRSVCPWKGTASYYDVVVGDEVAVQAQRRRSGAGFPVVSAGAAIVLAAGRGGGTLAVDTV